MMHADEVLAALVAGILLGLELEQRDAHHPVGQPRCNSRLRDALEAERLFVKLRRLLFVRHRDRDMS
jgi:hypothetical protein